MKKIFVGCFVLAVAVLMTGVVYAGDYVGASKCKMCHKLQYSSWETTAHAKAGEKLNDAQKADAKCQACHLTAKKADSVGVECEACHGAGSDYKSMSVMKDSAKAKEAGLIMPDKNTCLSCHSKDGRPEGHSPAKDFNFDERVKTVHDHK